MKAQNREKPLPGCLGRMVNLFDLSTGVAGNRMLADKPYQDHDVSSLSRSRSDVTRMASSFGEKIEDKQIVSELRRTSSNKKANRMPIKMLIDQEMSKEMQYRNSPPNVVAKLMGLDELPQQQPHSASQRCNMNSYSRSMFTNSDIPSGCWQEDDGMSERMLYEVRQSPKQNEYKDVYEVWKQPQNSPHLRNKSPQKGRFNENIDDKKMALIRQKFVEAKRLVTDEKLRQSKDFQDALEVLSSNKELFVKFLQEPNSLFSQNLYDVQSAPSPETKRITVLKPSKMVEIHKFSETGKRCNKQMKKPTQVGQAAVDCSGHSSIFSNEKVDEYPIQPTQIVILKPSPGKTPDIMAVVSSPSPSPRVLHGENIYEEVGDDEAQESKEVAEEIGGHMDENLMGHRRDKTLISSAFSNGYTGDESSFNKSENAYAAGNLNDFEVLSPSSRQSWDYINMFDSPISSSFGRASCSPESSVCREAKKRLSERWAMIASNGNSQEQRHVRRSSSTLGEMLALLDAKKCVDLEDGVMKDQEREPLSCLTTDSNKECGESSPRGLLRSKSVPVLSTVYDCRLNVEVSDPTSGKVDFPKELTKGKSVKSSLKGKVSSLFFSRNKKSSKGKSLSSQAKVESLSVCSESPGSLVSPVRISNASSQCVNKSRLEEYLSTAPWGSSSKKSLDVTSLNLKRGVQSESGLLSLAKDMLPVNLSENLNQPSPISVLEPPFDEDNKITHDFSGLAKPEQKGRQVPKSNSIDKSPPIESIARTLSWDDYCAETATPFPLNSSIGSTVVQEKEEDWHASVETLLSVAGLDGEVSHDSFFARWHSLDSPLDPSLRENYANVSDKEPLQEAKRRQLRASRKLVFDCVNTVLAEITGYGSHGRIKGRSCCGVEGRLLEGDSPMLVNCVRAQMKEWFSEEVSCVSGDVQDGDHNSLVVERLVRKEVVGEGWLEQMTLEIDNLGKEMQGQLLEELVEETLVDLTGRI